MTRDIAFKILEIVIDRKAGSRDLTASLALRLKCTVNNSMSAENIRKGKLFF